MPVPKRDRPKREDVTVKIDSAVYRKAKVVAAYRGVTLAEYLSDQLKKPVSRDYATMKEADDGDDSPD